MGYKEKCSVCGTSGMVPHNNERVADGTKLYRTQTEEYTNLALEAQWNESQKERAQAETRMKYIPQWVHFCPEHAKEEGIL